ncbi:uncharacterized protein LOC129567573 [Sitodiplosis mosellana]|uniref:uncharacterized protein LOC129567573 n=1 Tax=Sitodiplosis mosellana TaxID=263140 RepID=UPI002444D8F0|nr:uncharacterized protein LOC129567573 [Sitodiplosis mosellana]
MNNFVVHYKKKHLKKDCECGGKELCVECAKKVTQAKKLWRENKSQPIENSKSAEPATVQLQALAIPPSQATPQQPQPPVQSHPPEIAALAVDLLSVTTVGPTLPKTEITTSNASVYCSPHVIASLRTVSQTKTITATASIGNAEHKVTTQIVVPSVQHQKRRNSIASPKSISRMGTIVSTATALAEMAKDKSASPNSKIRRSSIASSGSLTKIETIDEKPAPTVYDKILEKFNSTNASSESAHIAKQAEDKHLNQANIDVVNREASKSQLDLDYVKKCRDIEKFWIIATYLRRNPHIDNAQIAKDAGVDMKKLSTFIDQSSHITCEQAMGLYPGAYVRLKGGFKENGINTELNKELREFASSRPEFNAILNEWEGLRTQL